MSLLMGPMVSGHFLRMSSARCVASQTLCGFFMFMRLCSTSRTCCRGTTGSPSDPLAHSISTVWHSASLSHDVKHDLP